MTTELRARYRDPGGNQGKDWIQDFWPDDGEWRGFEAKLNRVARGELYSDNDVFRFMVNDARSMIENSCNLTAALALLCFTEACGKLYTRKIPMEKKRSGSNFAMFLTDCMKCSDGAKFGLELYGDVRCGLVHNFFWLREKHRLEVSLGADEGNPLNTSLAANGYDCSQEPDGRQVWRVACMPFFRRFLQGLDLLAEKLAS